MLVSSAELTAKGGEFASRTRRTYFHYRVRELYAGLEVIIVAYHCRRLSLATGTRLKKINVGVVGISENFDASCSPSPLPLLDGVPRIESLSH